MVLLALYAGFEKNKQSRHNFIWTNWSTKELDESKVPSTAATCHKRGKVPLTFLFCSLNPFVVSIIYYMAYCWLHLRHIYIYHIFHHQNTINNHTFYNTNIEHSIIQQANPTFTISDSNSARRAAFGHLALTPKSAPDSSATPGSPVTKRPPATTLSLGKKFCVFCGNKWENPAASHCTKCGRSAGSVRGARPSMPTPVRAAVDAAQSNFNVTPSSTTRGSVGSAFGNQVSKTFLITASII